MARRAELVSGRHRRGLALTVTLLLGIGAWVAWRQFFTDTTTPVPVVVVVEAFRELQPEQVNDAPSPTEAAVSPAPIEAPPHTAVIEPRRVPATGVYVYDTTGSESIDGLGGAEHIYPPTTAVTVRTSECGVVLRWDGLEERVEQWEICWRRDQLVIPWYSTFHRFFGQAELQTYYCADGIGLLGSEVGSETQPTSCGTDSVTHLVTAVVEGTESIPVGSTLVEAVHIKLHFDIGLPGEGTTGITDKEMWLAVDDAMLVRWIDSTDATSDSFVGDVRYLEQLELNLSDLTPER